MKINRPGDRNYSAEADSGLSKELLGNFQTEHSCHSRLIKKSEVVVQRCSVKKVFLKISQNSQENTCASLFLNKVAGATGNFIKKETLAQMFSCEFCEIFKNICFTENLWTTASEKWSCLLKNVYYNDGMNLKSIY